MCSMTHPPTIDRKTLKSPDAFVSRGTQILAKFSKTRMGVWPIVALGLVLAAGFYGWDSWEEKQEQESWGLYYQATQSPDAEKWGQYEKVYTANPKSRAGMLAAVELADHFLGEAQKKGNSEDVSLKESAERAASWYQKAQGYSGLLAVEKQLLLINQGNAEELVQNYSASLASYEKAYQLKGNAKALALLGVGRSQEALGEKEKAAQSYEKVFMEFASTEYAKTAKMYWRKLKSPLLNSGASS